MRKSTYEAIQRLAREPEPVGIEIKHSEQVDTVDTNMITLGTVRKHVLSTAGGEWPLPMPMRNNSWERAVLVHEIDDTLLAWYRNPSTAGKDSLRIAHWSGEKWRSIQPDFVFVREKDGELMPSIVDPHSVHQGDTGPKLQALAQYADEYGERFDRIVAVGRRLSDTLYGLDLKDTRVRHAVLKAPADSDSLAGVYKQFGVKYADIRADN